MSHNVRILSFVIALFILIALPGYAGAQMLGQAQPDIRQLQPGLYAAGVPTDEFEYMAAPQHSGRQRQTNWCWAASIQMVLNYHGVRATQEEIVTRCFGGLVDSPAQPTTILAALNGWGVRANGAPVIISASPIVMKGSDIVSDLAYHWPMIVGFKSNQGIGHACVLTAVCYTVNPYNNEPLFQSVIIRDPWPTRQSRNIMTWSQFTSTLMFIARVRVTGM